MLAIAINALYTALRKRGTTRQLATVILACVCSALLLLPAIIWFNVRFSDVLAQVSSLEVTVALVYVALWGLVVPLGATSAYCLFTSPRESHTSTRLPRANSQRTTVGNAQIPISSRLPHRQPGLVPPFVYGEDTPWGWLEHCSGRLKGQKLALKRSVITFGREEDNDIWLDDDETSSRYHAELVWHEGQVYLTDCESLNGVILNGRRMRGSLPVSSGDLIEIGTYSFRFELAERPVALSDQDDPLLLHMRRSSLAPENWEEDFSSRKVAGIGSGPTRPIGESDPLNTPNFFLQEEPFVPSSIQTPPPGTQDALPQPMRDPVTPSPVSSQTGGLCTISNGMLAGRSFLLDRPTLTVGCTSDCDIQLTDLTSFGQYARFLHQNGGDFVSGIGVFVNNEAVLAPRQLHKGDRITLGNAIFEYSLVPEANTSSMPPLAVSPISRPISGPVPLRLPSRQK
ncbi:MAG TPA: FHA domain-containing protein [Ktedonobacteraceae bacterium]|jgi:pSer/pThr/pTyr-binding forkhead associated (FHA) protein|nr:FHA domain-containing protein [Ktedonobacteraceae bacterium]